MNSIKLINSEELVDTVFIKDFSRNNTKLKKIEKSLEENKNSDLALVNKLKKEMYLINQGLYGESSVYFELKNSLLPMLCFHDIKIKTAQTCAQIDFLVITNKFMCIMETKNLVGDITVNEDGDFIREIKYKDGITREGMYSPITQGRRHARILKKALIDAGILEANAFPIKSIAVMANHKNIIDKKNAPIEVSKNIYRCDQIVNFLEKEMNSSDYGMMLTDSKIQSIANKILTLSESEENDKETSVNEKISSKDNKISNTVIPFSKTHIVQSIQKEEKLGFNIEDIHSNLVQKPENKSNVLNKDISVSLNIYDYQNDKLIKMLRKFRYENAQINNKKPCEVFTNKEMDLLISNKPKTISDLKKINLRSWVINELGIKLLQVINPDISYPTKVLDRKDVCKNIEIKLKEYRDKIAEENNLKPYEIFTNAEILRLIEAKPSTIDELFEIKGFNKKEKILKYGEDILNMINI